MTVASMRNPGVRAWFVALVVGAGAIAVPTAPRGLAAAAAMDIEARQIARIAAPAYLEGRVNVRYRDSSAKSPELRAEVRAAVGGRVGRAFRALPAETLELAPGASVEEALQVLRADPRVAYAEPDYVYTLASTPSDQHFSKQWGLDNTGQPISDRPAGFPGVDVDGPEAWDFGTGSAGVVVAVIDQGIDVTHPDIAANAWVNPFEISGNSRDDDGNGYVDDVNGWD